MDMVQTRANERRRDARDLTFSAEGSASMAKVSHTEPEAEKPPASLLEVITSIPEQSARKDKKSAPLPASQIPTIQAIITYMIHRLGVFDRELKSILAEVEEQTAVSESRLGIGQPSARNSPAPQQMDKDSG
jgi:hypothetical protein